MKRKTDGKKTEQQKKKRARTNYSKEQLLSLESLFAKGPYPDLLLKNKFAAHPEIRGMKVHISVNKTYIVDLSHYLYILPPLII